MAESNAGTETLVGMVERVVFRNPDTGWTVLRVRFEDRPLVESVVGRLQQVSEGERLRLTGRWTVDSRHGRQFEVETCLPLSHSTVEGMERFLASGLVPGIGPVMAGRIVRRFGLETLDVVERSPERLAEVPGIGPKRAATIVASWAEKRAIRDVMIFLESVGVSPAFALRVHRQMGNDAIRAVNENPYCLASSVPGIGFLTADRIAEKLGVARDSPHRAEAGLVHALGELADEGHVFAPEDALLGRGEEILGLGRDVLARSLDRLALMGRVRRDGHGDRPAVYLERLHRAETAAALGLSRLLSTPAARLPIDAASAAERAERLSGITLAEGQRRAFSLLERARVLVLTGGPGTGKTTLLRGLVACLVDCGLKVALAAPTGRAARRMAEATGYEAKTLHRLLEWAPASGQFERDASNPLEAEIVFVDEMSMVDIELFAALMDAVKPRSRLVLVGDPDQLPSVGPGTVLADLVGLAHRETPGLEILHLTEIFRQAGSSAIVAAAHELLAGREPRTGARGEDSDFFLVERESPQECLDAIKEIVANRIPRRFGFDPVDDVQVLTPMHKGLLGATSLNAELQALLNPAAGASRGGRTVMRTGDKAMQVRNNYDLDVFNGDIGRVTAVDPDTGRVSVRFFENEVIYEPTDLDQIQLAYACSVHKAQGSEYPAVVVPLHTQHFVMLQRNLLYTAITRGKKLVVLVGSRKALRIAVRNDRQAERCSRLAERVMAAGRDPTVSA